MILRMPTRRPTINDLKDGQEPPRAPLDRYVIGHEDDRGPGLQWGAAPQERRDARYQSCLRRR
ncbi:MAG TPA: hypothetical protein VIK45_16475 [Candidatus Dormibacteraeota bacterium]